MRPALGALLVLCCLTRHYLAFPAARTALAKSALGDELISGSDFLSVFIGSTKPRSPSTKTNKQTESVNSSNFTRVHNLHLDSKNNENVIAIQALDDFPGTSLPSDRSEDEVAVTLAPGTYMNSVTETDLKNSTWAFSKDIQQLTMVNDPANDRSDPNEPLSGSSFKEIITSEKHPPMSFGDTLLSPSDMFVKKTEAMEEFANDTRREENQTHQVVSVKVSSSLAKAAVVTVKSQDKKNSKTLEDKHIFATLLDAFSGRQDEEDTIRKPPESASLVTEIQPHATAFQRSQLSVEETQPSSSELGINGEPKLLGGYQHEITFTSPPQSTNTPLTSVGSYRTSISTDTSSSSVSFYRDTHRYRNQPSAAETIHQTVGTERDGIGIDQKSPINVSGGTTANKPVPAYQQPSDVTSSEYSMADNVRTQKSLHIEGIYHREPAERNFEQSERRYGEMEAVFGSPEQNYEVDESVSVMTNGRVHGLQTPPSVTPDSQVGNSASQVDSALRVIDSQQTQDPKHNFSEVVKGRKFSKYIVEERTPDGFIVGEYGVVSHDDGSLRGVRYTADGTINHSLIYDALFKFLSL